MLTTSSAQAPTAAEISAIADLQDAALRNLWITWTYYRLNRAMAEVTGDANLTWCGFAVWASKTAGTFIRQQEIAPFLEQWIQSATHKANPISRITARMIGIHHEDPKDESKDVSVLSIRKFAAEVLGQVGGAIGGGNQDVFRHIAPPFAKLIALWRDRNGHLTDADRQSFLASLDNPADPQAKYLTQAFAATFDALAADDRTRAQRLLQANALIGCAEQTRVQPFIANSMNAPIADMFHGYFGPHLKRRFTNPVAVILHWLLHDLARALDREFQRMSTEWMMRLNVPGASLRLGENVPPLPDGQMYAAALSTLDAPQPTSLLEELNAMNAASSAAHDWVSYADRMRYIGVLFRSRQQDRTLWTAPFTDAQIDQLRAGRLPDGPL